MAKIAICHLLPTTYHRGIVLVIGDNQINLRRVCLRR